MKRLVKSKDKMLGGVLAGFAEYLEIDSVWIRIGYALFAFFGNFGIALVAYVIALIIMPHDYSETFDANSNSSRKSNSKINIIIGLCLIVLGLVFLVDQLYKIDVWQYMIDAYNAIKYYILAIIFIGVGSIIIFKGNKKLK